MTIRSAIIFETAGDFIEAVFGPLQHDAHVAARYRHLRKVADRKWLDEADKRVIAAVQEMKAAYRAKCEADKAIWEQLAAERASRAIPFRQAAE